MNDVMGPAASTSKISDYISLLKPRVMSLVVFSGLCGMLAAPGTINPLLGAIALLALAVGAGAAGAMNMWYDRDIDAVMNRTKNRALPEGRIEPSEALGFGVTLSIRAVVLMALCGEWVAAALLAFANFFYNIASFLDGCNGWRIGRGSSDT